MRFSINRSRRILQSLLIFLIPAPNLLALNGGTVAEPGDPLASSVVSIGYAYDIARPQVVDPAYCTGILIDDDMVITAARCVFGKSGNQLRVMFGHDLSSTNRRSAEVMNYEILSDFKPYESEIPDATEARDLAVLRFRGPLPLGYHKAILAKPTLSLEPKSTVTLFGYGYNRLDPCYQRGLLRKGESAIQNFGFSSSEMKLNSRDGVQAMKRDAGGPVFYQEKNEATVVGINIWGVEGRYSIATKISVYLAWISDAKERLRYPSFTAGLFSVLGQLGNFL